jgi:drug/metabolite transporter (DMT)-like permease
VSTSAFLLALGAAVLHAIWNVALVHSRDSEAATAVMLLAAIVLFAPAVALTWRVDWAAAPYIAGSAAFELAYFALLARAYRRSELSLVYPLARGLAPVLVLLVSVALLGASTSGAQAAGVLLVGRGVVFAVAIAACVAAYTLLDKEGIVHADALTYLELVSVGPALAYSAAIVRTKGAGALRSELGLRTLIASLALFGAYALVLLALDLAPAAPVSAVRESSVLFAMLLALVVLHERVTPARFAGAALIVAGVVLEGFP